MKLYISGPITGHPDAEQRFHEAAEHLRAAGYDPVNPFDIPAAVLTRMAVSGDADHDDWCQHLRADLIVMLGCDGVAWLPGSHTSEGASIERSLAIQVDIPTKPVSAWAPWAEPAA